MLIAGMFGWFLTGIDVKTASARISGLTGGYLRKTSTSVVSVGFH